MLKAVMGCLARGRDKRGCCEGAGVEGVCRPFCHPTGPLPKLRPRHLACALPEAAQPILACFKSP